MEDKARDTTATTAQSKNAGEPMRCACNKLLCIVRGDDIEIRCNKCKRYTLIKTRGIVGIERGDNPFTEV